MVAASGGAIITYDPLGRMFSARGSNGSVTHFLYDGDDLVAEYDASGALLRRYVHGPGSDEPLLWYEAGGLATRRILYADHQGSVTGVMRSDGTLEATNSYDDYGIPAGLPTATAANPANLGRFQYTGQLWMSELGLYYYKARMYSPFVGRFMQTDPIGYDDGTNLYAYALNDPLNFVDPTGESAVSVFVKQVIKRRGNVIEAAVDVGDIALTIFSPSASGLDKALAVAELVLPVSPGDVKDAARLLEASGKVLGGRKGGLNTRAQNMAIAKRIESNGGKPELGFGSKERRFSKDGTTRFSDGSARDRNGNEFQVQTVDTTKSGQLTKREREAAIDISRIGEQPVICISKFICR